jgi:hypothetical protein
MSMFKKLMLILCFGVTTSVFYGCTQQQPGGEEGAVVEEETVEEVAVPTPTPAPTVKATESGTN